MYTPPLQYSMAICGKVSAGLLVPLTPRWMLFTLPPLLFCASHLILLELADGAPHPGGHPGGGTSLGNEPFSSGRPWWPDLAITRSTPRLYIFACVYGLSFGLTHSLLTMQPVYLFGRLRLAYFQNLAAATSIVGIAIGQASTGYLYDASGGRYGPALLVTFVVSAINAAVCIVIGSKRGIDDEASPVGRTCSDSISNGAGGLRLF